MTQIENKINQLESTINPGPFVLSSLLTSYPDADFQKSVSELLEDESISLPNELRNRLQQLTADPASVDDLRSDYISIFDQAKSLNPLYETEYGRERAMFKANELSDIAGFYKAFGFEMNQDGDRDMVDHISVELEFYSLLQMKHLYLQEMNDLNGCDVVHDGMKKFMDSHLGRFIPAILERDGVKSSDIYHRIFKWIDEIVVAECARIGVSPEMAKWFSSQTEGENMCCGGTVAINK